MDQVYIKALKVETLIGVYEFERSDRQTLLLDLELDFDCRPAGESDDIQLALDYDALSRRVREWALVQTFELIETFAEQLCQLLHEEFSLARIQLVINKPAAVADCAAVGIKIIREFGRN
jgi:dihydroneopterin aldolase